MSRAVAVTRSGVRVSSTWSYRLADLQPDPVPVCQFDDDPPIPLVYGTRWVDGQDRPLYFSGLYLDAADVCGDQWAVMQGSTPDEIGVAATLLVKRRARTVEALPPHAGMYPVKLLPSGDVVFSNLLRGGAEGLAWVEDDGTEVYTLDARASITAPSNPAKGRPDPVPLWCPHTRRAWDWVIGQDVQADRILAWRRATDDLFVVWEGYSPIWPTGQQLADGSLIVAISVPGLWVHSSQFGPYTVPLPKPAPAPAARPAIRRVKPLRHLGLGAEFNKPRGTWTWSYRTGVTEPVMEGIGRDRRDIDTVPADHPMRAIWWTRYDNVSQFERDEAEREAAKRQCDLWVYCDRPDFDGIADATRLDAQCAQQAYSFDDAEAAEDAISDSLTKIEAAGLTAVLVGRADQTTGWSPDEVDDMLPRLVEIANDFPCVTDIAILHRGYTPGANDWPANRLEWWRSLIADNPPPRVVVPDTPELPVNIPVRRNRKGVDGQFPTLEVVGAAAAALVATKFGRTIWKGLKKLKFW